ncbi:hypothetical protein N7466_006438 [Penicillium verhagenii]|uniref:uncharacterized protein n=1 Tax=Penicillium verhagenii TaxID=1562060 RepID=UPI00254591E3|nr:uncharacterized protein N7466_006438 [Penicillium verhagenii]KAJ5930945.1 hypothetical protein N7466_006438 [Penicillium verhagenii]
MAADNRHPSAITGWRLSAAAVSTVYDVEHSSVNDAIKNWKSSDSNRSTTLIVQGTQRHTDVGDPDLIQAASIAGLGNSEV